MMRCIQPQGGVIHAKFLQDSSSGTYLQAREDSAAKIDGRSFQRKLFETGILAYSE
jgi:hypothetical protein